MKPSPKLLLIAGGFAFVLIIGFIWAHLKTPQANHVMASTEHTVFDVASGDTNNEVLRTILAKQEKLEADNQQLQAQNKLLEQKGITDLQDKMNATQDQFNQKLSETSQQLKEEIINKGSTSQSDKQNYPVVDSNQPHTIRDVPDLTQPLIPDSEDKNNTSALPTQNIPPELPFSQDTAFSSAFENKTQKKDDTKIPYYTIPANSTLANVSLMSAIIAEVPVQGRLVEPAFPFKALIGRKDLLAANGATLPDELSGMVVSGYSVGNMTMSCARAYVTSALFVFNDGHFEVYPKDSSDEEDATQLYPKNTLGYLSDPFGNTCLSGRYITNAPRVLTNLIAISTAGGVGAAAAQAETTTMTNANQSVSQMTGNMGQYALGLGINNASNEVLKWYLARVSNVFDAVYIPSSHEYQATHIVLNITQTIPIDFDTEGRTLREKLFNDKPIIAHQLD